MARTFSSSLFCGFFISRPNYSLLYSILSVSWLMCCVLSRPRPGIQCQAVGSRPAPPQPIRLTRPVQRHSPVPHIVLEEPVETG